MVLSNDSKYLLRVLLAAACLVAAAQTGFARDLASAQTEEGNAFSVESGGNISKEVEAVNGFGFRLLQDLSSGASGSDDNVFISPVSVSTALAMAAVGATEGSDTLKQLEEAFGGMNLRGSTDGDGLPSHPMTQMLEEALDFQSAEGSGVSVKVANGGWFKGPVEQTYKDDIANYFNASYAPLNRGLEINYWVSAKTDGLIREIVEPGNIDAIAVLINAIHFKGSWGTGFDKQKTRDATFNTPSGSADVKMMYRELPEVAQCRAVGYPACVDRDNTIYTHYEYTLPGGSAGIEVAEIGFGTSGNYSAVVMMPALAPAPAEDDESMIKAHTEALDGLMSALADNPGLWGDITAQADQKLKERNEALSTNSYPDEGIHIHLPRFKIDTRRDVVDSLRAMGIEAPFSGVSEQFLGISKKPQLYIEDVSHVASLEVNEDGAEAAAATVSLLVPLSLTYPEVVKFDRPFLFFITNKNTGTVLFSGRVNDPSSEPPLHNPIA